jgi:hypothetical protein
LALLGLAVVLAFLWLRPDTPEKKEAPSASQPAQPTATRQEAGRGWRDHVVFDGREWAIEDQSGAVVVRPEGAGGTWTSLAADAGWEAFLVENQTLVAVRNHGAERLVLDRLPDARSVSPDEGTGSGGEITRPAPPVRRTDEPASRR